MKKVFILILVFKSYLLLSQDINLRFEGGVFTQYKSELTGLIYGIGGYYLQPISNSETDFFRLELSIRTVNYRFNVIQRTGAQIKNLYGYFFFTNFNKGINWEQGQKNTGIGLGFTYRMPFDERKEVFEIGIEQSLFKYYKNRPFTSFNVGVVKYF